MSLNIKNEQTHQLVRQLAELTHQTQTSAVEDAVRRRIDELMKERERDHRLNRLTEIADEVGQVMDRAISSDPNDFVYDEYGLPR